MLKGTEKECEITKASTTDLRKLKEDDFGSQRVYKKTSPNSVLTLYLGTRDVICRQGVVEPLRGVIYIDPKFIPSHKIYGQLTLTFRYGREDEEVMGLKFCNEAIIALKQIWPTTKEKEELSSLQQALVDRLGKNAYPFSLDVGTLAPPSVQLIPAKRYNGAPIGTSYDVRIHMADQDEDRIQRRTMVKLGVRVIHKITSEARCTELPPSSASGPMMPRTLRLRLSPKALKLANKFSPATEENKGSMSRIDVEKGSYHRNGESKGPEGSVDKPFLWTEGRVSLRAALNKSAYGHGEHISVTIDVRNDSRKIIRKIRIFAVQHVDVCMFSNGKFKNIVAEINENHLIKPGENHRKTYSLLPIRGPTKNWIAVEGTPSHTGNDSNMPNYSYKIASSAPRGPQTMEERNVFAIYVSYYIKVKLTLSGMGGEVALKLPFILGHVDNSKLVTVAAGDGGGVDDITSCDTTSVGGAGCGGHCIATVGGGSSSVGKQTLSSSKIVEDEYCDDDDDDNENVSKPVADFNTAAITSDIALIDSGGGGGSATSNTNSLVVNSGRKKENVEKSAVEIDVIIEDDSSCMVTVPKVSGKVLPRNMCVGAASTVSPTLEGNVNVVTAQVHTSAV